MFETQKYQSIFTCNNNSLFPLFFYFFALSFFFFFLSFLFFMSTLVNQVLSQADKFPVINQWLSPNEQYNNKKIESYTPRHHSLGAPPPYENVVRQPKRYSFSSMIWKRASSFSSTACSEPEVELPMTTIDKKQVENGITLLNIATEMANSNNNKPMALDLYMMGLEKIMSALPCNRIILFIEKYKKHSYFF